MMKTQIRRVLALLVVFAFTLGFMPSYRSVAIATDDTATVSITAAYQGDTVLESVTLTDTTEVVFTVTVTQNTSDTHKISIELPVGVGLVSAPGIASVDTDGIVTAKDYVSGTESNYFAGTPTWDATGEVDGVATQNGTLSYELSKVSNVSFSFLAVINPEFIPIAYESITTGMGNVTVSLLDVSADVDATGAALASDAVAISATSVDSELALTSFTNAESFDNTALKAFCTTTYLATDRTDLHTLAFKTAMNPSVEGASYSFPIYSHSFTLTYPKDAVITYITTPISYAEVDSTKVYNDDGTVSVTVESTNTVTGTGAISCTFGTIDFSACYTDETQAGTEFDVVISDLSLTTRSFDVDTQAFETVTIAASADNSFAVTATVSATLASANELYTPYYDYVNAKNELYNDYTGEAVELYYAYRMLTSTKKDWAVDTDATADGTTLPIRMEYEATPTETAYLDEVTSVVMNVPFLGQSGSDRYTSQLTSITVWYESDDVGAIGISSETGHTLDISAFTAAVEAGSLQGSQYSASMTVDAGGIATYAWTANWGRAQSMPAITVTAPEGQSIVKISMEFTGDNATLWREGVDYGGSIVYGLPYDDEYTGQRSSYQFTTYRLEENVWVELTASEAGGFMWLEPETFALTSSNTSLTNQLYYYNVAKYNTTIYNSNASYNFAGYQNLGSVSIYNGSGSALPDDETLEMTFTKDTTSSDVIKAIHFPICPIDGAASIAKITYEYESGAKYVYDPLSGDDAPYTIAEDGSYALIEASGENSFVAFTVTYKSWSRSTAKTEFGLYGYIADTDNLAAADTHTIAVSIYDQDGALQESNSTSTVVNSTFRKQYNTGADYSVYGLVSSDLGDFVDGLIADANVLQAGLSSELSIRLVGGEFNNVSQGGWTEITFNIVLPDGITLDDVKGRDFVLEDAGEPVTNFTTNEEVGTISITSQQTMTAAEAQAHFGDTSVTGATVYTCTLDDPEVILYGYRNGAYGTAFSSFTVDLTLSVDVQTTAMAIPWSKVLYLGSNSSSYTTFEKISASSDPNNAAYHTGDGTTIDNFSTDSVLHLGNTSKLVQGSADEYLLIATDPTLLVHDAHVTVGETEYYYSEHDADSMAVLGSGESATIEFSVTNTLTEDLAGKTNYVLIPLPASATGEFVETADVLPTITEIIVDGTSVMSSVSMAAYSSGTQITAKFVSLDGDTAVDSNNIDEVFAEAATVYSDEYNVMVLEITDQETFDSFDVAITVVMPTHETTEPEIVTLQAGSIYYFSEYSQTEFMSGNDANSYIQFAYSNPKWTVSFDAYAVNTAGQITSELSIALNDLEIFDKNYIYQASTGSETDAVITAPEQVGYNFIGWYADEDLTQEFFPSDTTQGISITADTILYAKYEIDQVEVIFVLNNGSGDVTKTVNWTDSIASYTTPQQDGYTFINWFTDDTFAAPVTETFYGPADTDGDGYLTLYAGYSENPTYSVTFDIDGDTAVEGFIWEDVYEAGEKITLPDALPTKEGYAFAGWEYDGSIYRASRSFTIGNDDVVFVAEWTRENYTLNYYDKDGTTLLFPAELVAYQGEVVLDAPDDITGYSFDYWLYGTDKYAEGDTFTMPASNVDLIAVWKANTYTLSLANVRDGDVTEAGYTYANGAYSTAATYQAVITLPSAARAGYTFGGWVDANGDSITSVTIGDGDVTVTAKWKALQYEVSYDTNGGDAITGGSYDYESTITLPTPTKTGNQFLRWEDEAGAHYPAGSSYTIPTASTTFTAVWKALTYEIKFVDDVDGSIVYDDIDANYEDEITLPSASKTGYTLEGWSYDGTTYAAGDSFTALAADTTFVSDWKINAYSITFDAASDVASPITQDYGTDVTIPTPTAQTGYTFSHWVDETGKTYVPEQSITMPEGGLALTAVWKTNSHTVSYTETGTHDYSSSTVFYGTQITLHVPSKTGYTFDGWLYDGKTYAAGATFTMVDEAVDFEGQWTALTYDITFDYDDGDDGTADLVEKYAHDAQFTFTTPERAGYTFTDWLYNGGIYQAGDLYTVSGAATFTALWKANTYTISFENAGDAAIDSVVKSCDSLYTLPIPIKLGYTFTGWSITSGSGSDSDSDSDSVSVSTYAANEVITVQPNDMVFTGGWTVNPYTVWLDTVYEVYDGDTEITQNYGEDISLPTLEKDGYTFNGWLDGEKLYAPGQDYTMGATSVILTASWTANVYTITFESTGKTTLEDVEVACDDTYTLPSASRSGYTFKGWKDEDGTLYKAGASYTMPTGDVTLTGSWSKNSTSSDTTEATVTEDTTTATTTTTATSSTVTSDTTEAAVTSTEDAVTSSTDSTVSSGTVAANDAESTLDTQDEGAGEEVLVSGAQEMGETDCCCLICKGEQYPIFWQICLRCWIIFLIIITVVTISVWYLYRRMRRRKDEYEGD
ncbi:MAG: InlB B-repeat-containing protein [Faecalibacterium sp.]